MANFNDIKHEIDQNVNTNGVQAITGAILNETLKDMIDEVDEKKQDTLVAGSGISINGNVISATGGSGQTYTAGDGIDIDPNNVISVDASDLAGSGLEVDEFGALKTDPSLVQSKLTAGANIQISGSTISATDTTYSAGDGIAIDANTNEISARVGLGLTTNSYGIIVPDTSVLQEKLTAGDGLEIDANNEISVKAGSGLGFDANGYLVNTGGGGGATYTAGSGIDIDSNNVISAKAGPGLLVDPVSNNIELDRSALNFLPLEGGILQDTTPLNDTTLTVMDGMNEDYVRIVAPENAGEAPHVEIFENGSGDTKFYYDHLERGSQTTINYPTISGTLALTSDIPYAPVYSAGNGIDITNTTISVDASDLDGSGLNVDANGALEVDTTAIQEKLTAGANITISGNTISATDTNTTYSAGSGLDLTGTTFSVDTTTIQEKLTAGTGISISGNTISATGGGGSGLWTNGTGTNSLMTPDAVSSGSTAAGVGAISAGHLDSQHPSSLSGADGDYSAAFGTGTWATGDNAFVSGEYNTAQGQRSFVAGGINNAASGRSSAVIGGDGGSAVGENCVAISGGTAGPGSGAVAIKGTATALGSIAIGGTASASLAVAIQGGNAYAASSVAIKGTTDGDHSVAVGHRTHTTNEDEVATGYYNKSYQSSTDSVATAFTVGNGEYDDINLVYDNKNAIELKKNNDLYVIGIGNFDGTNSGASGVQTLQDVVNNGGGGTSYTAGSGIDITGTTISVDATDLDGSGLNVDANGALEVDTTAIQEKLTAGSNITISGSTISATDTTYSAGTGLSLNGTTFSADTTVLATQNDLSGKQDTLVSGTNIKTINGNSLLGSGDITVGGGGGTSYTAGSGIDITGSTISADDTYFDGKYLSLNGGTLSDQSQGSTGTIFSVVEPSQNYDAYVSIMAEESDPTAKEGQIALFGSFNGNFAGLQIHPNRIFAGGNGDIYFPSVAADDTFAVASDLAGKQDTLVSGTNIKTINGTSILGSGDITVGGGGSSYTAGNGIDITGTTISADDTYFDGKYLSLNGGSLSDQTQGATGTTLIVAEPSQNYDAYVSISADEGDPTAKEGQVSIIGTHNGNFSSLQLYSNRIFAGGNGDIYFPSPAADDTFALASEVSAKQDTLVSGTNIKTINGTSILGSGDITVGGGGNYLSLDGGTLKDTTVGATETLLDIVAPDTTGAVSFSADTLSAMIQMSADKDDASVSDGDTYGVSIDNSGEVDVLVKTVNPSDPTDITTTTYSQTFQQKSGTIALLSDITGSSYTAGAGINIDANNEISSTTIVPGTGQNSIKTTNASASSKTSTIALGQLAKAEGNHCVAMGFSAEAGSNTNYAISIGKSCTTKSSECLCIGTNCTTGSNTSLTGSSAVGHYIQALNSGEMGIGNYNHSINSGTTAEKTSFTIGNGTANNSRSNLLEAKQNNDVYLVGVGGFDGTNAGATGVQTLQAVINSAGGGGSCLWSQGSGQNSLLGPGASGADGDYSVAAGYDSSAQSDYSVALAGGIVVSDNSDPDNPIDAQYGVAIGEGATVNGVYGIAIGKGSSAGSNCMALGEDSIAYGYKNVALAGGQTDSGNYNFGATTGVAAGNYSVALAGGNSIGEASLALGQNTVSNCFNSVALGLGAMTYDNPTIQDDSDPNAGEVALGRYNYSEQGIVFSVGCGSENPLDADNPNRQNAITIDSTGKIFLKGLGGYTGTSTSGCTDLVSFLNSL